MKKAILIISGFNIFRLFIILFADILPNETVFIFSENSPNVFSKFTTLYSDAWLSGISNFIIDKGIIVVRLACFLLSLISQWGLYLLISKIIRTNKKYFSWVIMGTVFSITYLSITTLTDALLFLFWILSMLSLYNAIFEYDKKSWLISGIFMGVALLNKLSGLALPAGLFLFLIFSSRYRKYLFTPWPYITLLLTVVFSFPMLIGLYKSSNILMQTNQTEAVSQLFNILINQYTGFVGFQILLIFPILYIGLWWVTFKYFGRIFKKPNQVNPELWFLFAFFIPLFTGFHLISVFGHVDFLGLIPVYIPGMIVLLKLIKRPWMIWSFGFSIISHLWIIIVLLF